MDKLSHSSKLAIGDSWKELWLNHSQVWSFQQYSGVKYKGTMFKSKDP